MYIVVQSLYVSCQELYEHKFMLVNEIKTRSITGTFELIRT